MLTIQYNWGDWLTAVFGLAALYFALRFMERRLAKAHFFGKHQSWVQRVTRSVLLIYEPIALLVLGVGFVFIDPLFHGLGVGVVLLAGFAHAKNYLNGLIVKLDENIKNGMHLTSGVLSGFVSKMGRMGLWLTGNKGKHYLSYSKLLAEGFLLHSGEQVRGYYKLNISPKDKSEKTPSGEKIMDMLVAAPYLDWEHKPDFHFSEEEPGQLNARVSVKEEDHLHDLISLIGEWGYVTKIVKN